MSLNGRLCTIMCSAGKLCNARVVTGTYKVLIVREHIPFILSVVVFTQLLKQFPLRFVANYEYLKRNDMKRRMLIIISSTHIRTLTCMKCRRSVYILSEL